MTKLIIGFLGIIFLCSNCSVATKSYVTTELNRQSKKIESSARILDSLFVNYRARIDSNQIQLARLTGRQQTFEASARALDSLLANYQARIDSDGVRLAGLQTAYDNLQSEMQVVRKIDIPNLQTRDQQFEMVTENLITELETLSRQSLRELANLIEAYLQQSDSLLQVKAPTDQPAAPVEPAASESEPEEAPDPEVPR